jgi:NADH dehydrogenase [ubiquinone] 1 alpha subcomplex assembly factor 7
LHPVAGKTHLEQPRPGLRHCAADRACPGIRNHKGVHPLSQPGTADLSAWVDFSAVRLAAEQAFDIQPAAATDSSSSGGSGRGGGVGEGVEVFGPVTQEHLLHSLGIQARLQSLAEVSQRPQHQQPDFMV